MVWSLILFRSCSSVLFQGWLSKLPCAQRASPVTLFHHTALISSPHSLKFVLVSRSLCESWDLSVLPATASLAARRDAFVAVVAGTTGMRLMRVDRMEVMASWTRTRQGEGTRRGLMAGYCGSWAGYCTKLPFLSFLFVLLGDLLRENQNSVSGRTGEGWPQGSHPGTSLWLSYLLSCSSRACCFFVFFLKLHLNDSPGNSNYFRQTLYQYVLTGCVLWWLPPPAATLQWFPLPGGANSLRAVPGAIISQT